MNGVMVEQWGTATRWQVREEGKTIGFVFGDFEQSGRPVYRIERQGLLWPDKFYTFAGAEAKVREI